MILNIVIQIIGGLGIFLYGMKLMSSSIQKLAGEKLRKLISSMTGNVYSGILTGIVVTIIVQSSSVTTVMLVGFLNAGLMTLKQAIGVILGAGIGTTLTGWILALNIDRYGLLMIGLGVLISLFSKNIKIKERATVLIGIGMIFYGLSVMKLGVIPVKDMPKFISFFSLFSAESYKGIILSALMGAFVTSILQSSAATIGITMALAIQGVINPNTAVALVLGQNIGTTITAYLASLGAKLHAKRAAYAHIFIKIIGVIIIIPLFYFYIALIGKFVNPNEDVAKYIALSHTIFNIGLVIIFIPFIDIFLKFLRIIGGKDEGQGESYNLNKLYDYPDIILEKEKLETLKMMRHLKGNLNLFNRILNDKSKESMVNLLFIGEKYQDKKQESINRELTGLLNASNSKKTLEESRSLLKISDQLESMGDYIASLGKIHIKMKNSKIKLDEKNLKEINKFHKEIISHLIVLNNLHKAPNNEKLKELSIKCSKTSQDLEKVNPLKEEAYSSHLGVEILAKYRRINRHILYIVEEIIIGKK